jgi:hypothetical protein
MRALVGLTRIRAAALAMSAACVVTASGATAGASSGTVRRCETITVKRARWGVYVSKGKVGCERAGMVLTGVLAGKGTRIVNSGTGGVRYDGWLCPYNQMGVVTCQYGTKPVARPARSIFALSCATKADGEPGCPARGED